MRPALPRLALLSLAIVLLAAPPSSAKPPETKRSAQGLTYSVRIPDGYAKGRAPLILALHGAGDTCENFMRWLTDGASTLPKDAILLAPQALKDGAWDQPDIEPLGALVREIQAEHAPPRTLGIGFSRGAYFVFALAIAAPELLQGAIPHSGGLPMAVPGNGALDKVPFYIIHGDADKVVPVAESEKALAALQAAKVPCSFDKVARLEHTMDRKAVQRGLDWIAGWIDEHDPNFEAALVEKIAALEKALKGKAWDDAVQGFAGLARAPQAHAARIAALAKPHVASSNEPLALAAIAASGRCGADGVAALKSVPAAKATLAQASATALGATGAPAAVDPLLAFLKAKPADVAVAAAESLGRIGGDAATTALVTGLAACENAKPGDARKPAILAALTKITGQSFATSKEWKKWLAEQGKK